MPYGILSAFFSVALFTLGGCVGAIERGDMAKALEVTLPTYGEAMRWGYRDRLQLCPSQPTPGGPAAHRQPTDRQGYEVVEGPRMYDGERAEQLVRIRYVHEDVQRLRSLSDRQLWRYDKAASGWWLESGIPSFE